MAKLLINRIRVSEMKVDPVTGQKTYPKREIIDRRNVKIETDETLSEFRKKTVEGYQDLGFENIEIDLGFKDFTSDKTT